MKWIIDLIAAALFIAIVALTPRIVDSALADQSAKAQLAEINHIMYGLLNINAWKHQIAEIVYDEIRGISLKTTTKKFKSTIESQLSAVIDKLNEHIRKANGDSLGGRIKQMLIDLVVDVETVKKGIPSYADAMIEQMTTPKSEKLFKDLATKKIKTYLSKTFAEQNMAPINAVLEKTDSATVAEANKKLNDEIKSRRADLEENGYLVIGLAIVLFACVGFSRRSRFGVGLLFATLIVLLVIGVAIPMIDLEAKISEMSFVLIGHKIAFENQYLYFQSKSVLNVFELMITHPDLKMKLVGVLLVMFSVVFPVLKLTASICFFYFERTRGSRLLQFFAFKTGKWSMTDVMVIAILMCYIGFNGIVETQFGKMKALVPEDVVFFTTNGTTLQMGYYIFLAYVILAMVLAQLLSSLQRPSADARP